MGPYVFGLAVMIVVVIFLVSCCCMPDTCPPKFCSSKPIGEVYSRCELIWPGLVLLACLSLILAAGIYGIVKTKDIQTAAESVGCSIAISIDDIRNGNATSTGQYFVGTQSLSNSLSNFAYQLSSINFELQNISSAISYADDQYTDARSIITRIPKGSAGQRADPIAYKIPFDVVSTNATGTILSNLPAALGSTNGADSNTSLYILYSGLG